MNICDKCGKPCQIGDWPWCPHGAVIPESSGKEEYFDDNVAPPPGPEFRPPKGIDYHPDKGYRITNRGDKLSLMRRNKADYRN